MTAKDLERVLSMVPEDTPVRFEIGGMELHATSAVTNHGSFDLVMERGKLTTFATGEKAEEIVIQVAYGPGEI
jgi:hypothetical protein